MTHEELRELKDELSEVRLKIERMKDRLNILERRKSTLEEKLTKNLSQPISTDIEYLFSRFDYEQSIFSCSKATVTRAKKLLHNLGYSDLVLE